MKRTIGVIFLLLVAATCFIVQRWALSGGGANPSARFALPAQRRIAISGRIEEQLLAGPYAYYRVRDARGAAHWIVTLRVGTPSRDEVEAAVYARADSFHSKRLGRDFAPLWFGTVRAAASSATATQRKTKEGP